MNTAILPQVDCQFMGVDKDGCYIYRYGILLFRINMFAPVPCVTATGRVL